MEKGFMWGYQSPRRYKKSMVAVGEVEAQGLEQVGVGIRIGDDGGLRTTMGFMPEWKLLGDGRVLIGVRDGDS
jgi:hypothetical protein